MLQFEQDHWEDFPGFYAKVRLSNNQIKELLQQHIEPFSTITIRISQQEKKELTRAEVITKLMEELKRNEIVEMIHHLYLINKRKSNNIPYVKFILKGLISKLK
ncbi:hypothetical protein [Bacillus sp. FJAT-49736]|uniref:hypothetical protein n=1 Tax=Bacillus sp. FJAT-49736 TaxID=2833582 RepID=UPI001BC9E107|nr:hypothetical protein [Bacillus sp. FJAT-49736]MBS4174142.1 hypothetical protein [Bacillus sp. FJAT-49736]